MEKRNYKKFTLWGSIILLLFVFPQVMPLYHVYLAGTVAIYITCILGVNLLTGNTGQVTVGHAGFFAIGAYTSAIMQVHLGTSLLINMLAGGLAAALVGFFVGILALRIMGAFLAITTLGFGFAVHAVINNVPIFQGRTGISLDKAEIFGFQLNDVGYYYLVVITLIITILFVRSVLRSGVGRAFMAIKNSENAAQAVGINLRLYKTMAFTISAFITGVAGVLFGQHVGFLSAEIFTFWMSTAFLVAVVVGGLGSILGSIIGGAYVVLVPYFLADYQDFSFILMGIVLIAVIAFAPNGLAGVFEKTYNLIKGRLIREQIQISEELSEEASELRLN